MGLRLPLAVCLAAISISTARAQSADTLSVFATRKAEALIRQKMPCLGCHQLDSEGGKIGPDLSLVGARRTPARIRAMITMPGQTVPGTAMPRTPMTAPMVNLLTAYLSARGRVSNSAGHALSDSLPPRSSTPASAPRVRDAARDAPSLYRHYCAACHGVSGRGDGFNAPFLPAPPARLASRGEMSRRTDDRLYDAIHGGGSVLGRSPRMPAFGETLSRQEIRGLVRHIRRLCSCDGPAWSRDGTPR